MNNILNKYINDKNFTACIYQWAGLRNINIIYLRSREVYFMMSMRIIPEYNHESITNDFSNDSIENFFRYKNNNNATIKKLKNICNYTVDIFSYYKKKRLPIYPFVKPLSIFIEE